MLASEASLEDLINFNEITLFREDAANRIYVDSIFQVSVSVNRHLYDQMMKVDNKMCEAIKDLLKEDFVAAEAREEVRGEARGEIKRMIILYHEEMGLTPQEIIIRIMGRFFLDEETAKKYGENTLELQPA